MPPWSWMPAPRTPCGRRRSSTPWPSTPPARPRGRSRRPPTPRSRSATWRSRRRRACRRPGASRPGTTPMGLAEGDRGSSRSPSSCRARAAAPPHISAQSATVARSTTRASGAQPPPPRPAARRPARARRRGSPRRACASGPSWAGASRSRPARALRHQEEADPVLGPCCSARCARPPRARRRGGRPGRRAWCPSRTKPPRPRLGRAW